MNTLDEDGNCKHCSKDAQSENMECWICREKFHVIECAGVDNMVQPSFLRNQWSNIRNKWPCLTFTCSSCRENIKTREEAVMSGRVRLLEENSVKTNRQLEEIKDLLTTVINKPSHEDKAEPDTNKSTRESPSLIVVEKPAEEEETDEEQNKLKWSEVTKRAITSKAGVEKSWINSKTGQAMFLCNSEKSKNALLPHVEEVYRNRKINTPKPRLPTISVPFIHGNYEKEELLKVLHDQNEERGINFSKDNSQVLFTVPMKDKEGLHQAVIRVSESIREKIKTNGDRLCIGINSCPVYDRFFIKRCNRCQSYHHFQNDNGGCKKDKVCALCTGNHDTRSCRTDEHMHKCANCVRTGKDDFMHAAYSLDCPTYKEEQDKLKKSIHYYTKNT